MSHTHWILLAAFVLAAIGCGLMLPGPSRRIRNLGIALAIIAAGLLGSRLTFVGSWGSNGTFGVLAAVTIVAAAGAISCKNPVYCAIWFGLSLVGTAGLFLYQGAQFLGVATIVVYAGAILVMFLFVLMLAQPRGSVAADRLSWNAFASAAAGAALVGLLTTVIVDQIGIAAGQAPLPAKFTEQQLAESGGKILAPDHSAQLGAELFGRHLIAIEIAGTLLLVALVGTVTIVAYSKAGPGGESHHG